MMVRLRNIDPESPEHGKEHDYPKEKWDKIVENDVHGLYNLKYEVVNDGAPIEIRTLREKVKKQKTK